MGSYYKHKKTESIKVPYSFRCEQCMKDSGPLMATISGMEATVNSNYKELEYNKQQTLNEQAHKNLVRAVKDAHTNATQKQIYSKDFKDECPNCHKPQSWAVSGLKDDMFSTPIVLIIVGIIAAAGCYFFSGVDNPMTVAIIAGAIFVVLAAGSLILNIIKIASKTKKTSTASQKNVPVIEWGAEQHILDEK